MPFAAGVSRSKMRGHRETIDPQTRDIVQNIYIRAVKDPIKAAEQK
jgi:hypothetical protein